MLQERKLAKMNVGVLFILFVVATVANAWGPATHYYMACQSLPNQTMSGCFSHEAGMLAGAELPDAFYFGHDAVTDPNCHGLGALHSPLLAGEMLKLALTKTDANRYGLIPFALGYGAHVVADFAGFFPKGYLTKATNWIEIWPLMTAVDAHVTQTLLENVSVSSFPDIIFSTKQRELVVEAAQQLAKKSPGSVPNVTVDQISNCTRAWNVLVSRESSRASKMDGYRWEMQYEDLYGATTFASAKAHFEMAAGCAVDAIQLWWREIQSANSTPESVILQLEEFYYAQFAAGKCAPRN